MKIKIISITVRWRLHGAIATQKSVVKHADLSSYLYNCNVGRKCLRVLSFLNQKKLLQGNQSAKVRINISCTLLQVLLFVTATLKLTLLCADHFLVKCNTHNYINFFITWVCKYSGHLLMGLCYRLDNIINLRSFSGITKLTSNNGKIPSFGYCNQNSLAQSGIIKWHLGTVIVNHISFWF